MLEMKIVPSNILGNKKMILLESKLSFMFRMFIGFRGRY
jgi:hypothetical protein